MWLLNLGDSWYTLPNQSLEGIPQLKINLFNFRISVQLLNKFNFIGIDIFTFIHKNIFHNNFLLKLFWKQHNSHSGEKSIYFFRKYILPGITLQKKFTLGEMRLLQGTLNHTTNRNFNRKHRRILCKIISCIYPQ